MDNQLCSCGRQSVSCTCYCSNQSSFCDDCLKIHLSTYKDYFHIPILINENSGPNLKGYHRRIRKYVNKRAQAKHRIIDGYVMDVLNHLKSLKDLALKEDPEMLFNILDTLTGKGENESLERLKLFIKSGYEGTNIIKNDNLEENIKNLKNSLIKNIKSTEHIFCYKCQKMTELISLNCYHKLCKTCFISEISSQTDGKIVLNIQEQKDIVCTFKDCETIIEDQIKRTHIPDYEKFEEEAKKRTFCNKCMAKDIFNLDSLHTSCHHNCEECVVNTIRSGKTNCHDFNVPYSDEELKLFREKNKKCDGCYESKNWIKLFPRKLCSHFVCIECLSEIKDSQQCFVSENCANFNLDPIEFQQLFKIKCKNCPSMIYKSSNYWFNKNCECVNCEDCQLKLTQNNFSKCYECNSLFNEATQLVLQDKHKSNMNETTKACPVCGKSIRISKMVSLSGCIHEFCKTCVKEYVKACVGDVSMMDQLNKCMACQAEIPGYQLEDVIGIVAYREFMFYTIQKKYVSIINCRSCQNLFDAGFQRKAECINCNNIFCQQCFEPYHEDANCQEALLQTFIEIMENMKERNQIVAQCPRCRIPNFIDNCCNYVDCKPGCGVKFCYTCACLASPAFEHGNHYHRKECCFYAPIEQKYIHLHKELGKRDCIECQRLGYKHLGEQHCQPPKSLRVPRRVAPDEV